MKKLILYVLLIFMIFVPNSKAEFAIVPVKEVIDGGLAAFVERAINESEENGKEGIIFHIDTPGGRIDSAVYIKDTILRAKITTIAFVDKNAISAGALISIACDSVYMSTGSSIGAATAVDLQGKKASEKVISYFRAQMRATAEANERRADIAEAMVDEELEIEGITEQGMLVTLTFKEALDLGISDGTVETIEDVLSLIGHEGAKYTEYRLNWAEYIVRALTHPVVSSLLMSIGFMGLVFEIRTPGWGIGGTIALIALALFFGSHYIVRLAGFGELLLFAIGIILLAFEVFIIPGFGIAGVSGIALIFVSLYLSLVGSLPSPEDFINATYTNGLELIFTIITGYWIIKAFPRTSFFRKLTLAAVESSQEGYTSSKTMSDMVGEKGVALNNLRPVGKAEINGRRLDVVTEGGYIEKDASVIVTEVDGSRIVVREIENT